MKKVLIAGGTGMIGKKLTSKLKAAGYRVGIISRDATKSQKSVPNADEHIVWANDDAFFSVFEDAYCVINLAGSSIADGRWTKANKKIIYDSRIAATDLLVNAINKSKNKVKVFISASGIDYYGETKTDTYEDHPRGSGFLADVCNDWENSARKINPETRLLIARIGIVLDEKGGALAKMVPPFMMFVGGPIGNGKQWMPFIHVDDLTSIFQFMIENESLNGAVNCVAPKPVTMKEFANTLGNVLQRPSIFPVPSLILKIIMGSAADIVLKGHKVIPKKLLERKFNYKYDNLEYALKNLLKKLIIKFQK